MAVDITDYLIDKAKCCLKEDDSWMAKSWYLTAAAVYPDSFTIQFERYKLAKSEKDVAEANRFFCVLMKSNVHGHELQHEQKLIVDAIKAGDHNQEQEFLNSMFDSLSDDVKYSLLMEVSGQYKDNLAELGKLMLFILNLFPDKLREEGSKLLNLFSRTDSKEANDQRKAMLFEVLPLILSDRSTFEFQSFAQLEPYLIEAFQLYSGSLEAKSKSSDSSKEIEAKLAEVMKLTAAKFKWDTTLYNSLNSSVDMMISHVTSLVNKNMASQITSPDPVADDCPIDLSASNSRISSPSLVVEDHIIKQVTYAILFIFMKCLHVYGQEVAERYILVEKYVPGLISSPSTSGPPVPAKKRKLNVPIITPDKVPRELNTTNLLLKKYFSNAVHCSEILEQHSPLIREFQRMLTVAGVDKLSVYDCYRFDEKFFKAEYEDLVQQTRQKTDKGDLEPFTGLRCCLQVMSASMMQSDYQSASTHALYAADLIKANVVPSSSSTLANQRGPKSRNAEQVSLARQLYFIESSSSKVLEYSIEVMIQCLKQTVLKTVKPTETGLGHLIVLCQYEWPKYVELFMQVTSAIEAPLASVGGRGQPNSHRFTYMTFMDYVFIPDILEEFMSLASNDHLVLELSPGLGTKPAGKSMTTRGVNKGAKEEVKVALVNQMSRARNQIDDDMFIDFILKSMRNSMLGQTTV
ncbi:Integrator complex subunit 10 [Halotydeus destructor]|nr:Integrator complex subunit 10 [Halotydeus destructor]